MPSIRQRSQSSTLQIRFMFGQRNAPRKLLDISKAKLDEVDDELRRTFQAMEESGTAHERSADQLKDELETLREKLELLLATDPGVIEQYERRKEEIKSLSRKLEERERHAAKLEKSIKVARDNWQPALQDLVTSIGKKFSEAFDRASTSSLIKRF
ncbi:hypothetical protein B0F90DRAFT_183826 [Multifurca ochricompacta]|uniref:Uncharacterized protein n=1 Tax=Multifurca ochricompacta TaxID=376703 RepID=A0AAD4M7Z4_9AGAM|nr:hypothetical protein B0F90DRAFT_183826 [Multifurca ochricompacta]